MWRLLLRLARGWLGNILLPNPGRNDMLISISKILTVCYYVLCSLCFWCAEITIRMQNSKGWGRRVCSSHAAQTTRSELQHFTKLWYYIVVFLVVWNRSLALLFVLFPLLKGSYYCYNNLTTIFSFWVGSRLFATIVTINKLTKNLFFHTWQRSVHRRFFIMEMKQIKRPKMSGLLHDQIKRNLAKTLVFVVAAGLLHRFLVVYPERKRYADFYKLLALLTDVAIHFHSFIFSGIMIQKKNFKEWEPKDCFSRVEKQCVIESVLFVS